MTPLDWAIVAIATLAAAVAGFGLWKKRPDVAIGGGLFAAALLAIAKLIPNKKNVEETTDPTLDIPKPTYTSTTSTVELETEVKKNEIETRAKLTHDERALLDDINERNRAAEAKARAGNDTD